MTPPPYSGIRVQLGVVPAGGSVGACLLFGLPWWCLPAAALLAAVAGRQPVIIVAAVGVDELAAGRKGEAADATA